MEGSKIEVVNAECLATPKGHYSHAVCWGGLIFVSGQLPMTRDGKILAESRIETQIQQCLSNLEVVLEACGSSLERVLRLTIYVSDVGTWQTVDREIARQFGSYRPSRTVVPTNSLHFGCAVELDAIACREGISGRLQLQLSRAEPDLELQEDQDEQLSEP